MSRALVIIHSDADRARASKWCLAAPPEMRIEFKTSKRTNSQNSLMWACLSDVAAQKEHNGRKYTPDAWKSIFLHALGHETEFVPTLDNKAFLPLGQSSSDLSRSEMSELIDFITTWGAQNGIIFHDRP